MTLAGVEEREPSFPDGVRIREVRIGNLASSVTKEKLYKHLLAYGEIEDMLMLQNFAFVKFREVAAACRAHEQARGLRVDGRPIEISFSERKVDLRVRLRLTDPDAFSSALTEPTCDDNSEVRIAVFGARRPLPQPSHQKRGSQPRRTTEPKPRVATGRKRGRPRRGTGIKDKVLATYYGNPQGFLLEEAGRYGRFLAYARHCLRRRMAERLARRAAGMPKIGELQSFLEISYDPGRPFVDYMNSLGKEEEAKTGRREEKRGNESDCGSSTPATQDQIDTGWRSWTCPECGRYYPEFKTSRGHVKHYAKGRCVTCYRRLRRRRRAGSSLAKFAE